MTALDGRAVTAGGYQDYLVRYYEERYKKYIKRMGTWLVKDLERKSKKWDIDTKHLEISADVRITLRKLPKFI